MKRKNVALTTWFNYHNYGTALQVVALSETIKSLGCNVDVINYIPHGTRYSDDKATDWGELERVLDPVRENKFSEFISKNLTFTHECRENDDFIRLNKEYQAFIAGSDQIWSPIVFDSRYYLDYVTDNRKKIAYAPSTGVQEVKNASVKEKMKNLISQFACLSAREAIGTDLIQSFVGRKAEMVLDPTLLLDYDAWRKIIPATKLSKNSKKYILCYFLGDNENSWKHANKISDQLNIPLKVLPVFARDTSYATPANGAGPEEFFELIDGAEVVLTDSYHGAIVALLCSKPFYAFERFRPGDPMSQNSRIYELLKTGGLTKHLIGYDDSLKEFYDFDINISKALREIQARRDQSLTYLKKSLNIRTPLVSVIVPVYNVEPYIKRCLSSIVSQEYDNLEIIVVNDGATDKSGKISDDFAMQDHRITVLHKKNEGVSMARNAGIELAKGDYVIFIDADDIIAPNFIEYMLGLAENTGCNIGASVYSYNEYCGEQGITALSDRFEMYTPERAIEAIYDWSLPLAVWNKIYKRSFIEENNLRFLPDLVYAEGMTFNIMALQYSGPICVGRKQLYYQTYNPTSATRSPNIAGWATCRVAYKYQKQYSRIWNKNIARAYDFHVWLNNIVIARQIYRSGEESLHKKDLDKYVRNMRRNLMHMLRAKISVQQKIKHMRIALSPRKELNKLTKEEANRVKDNFNLSSGIMPWDKAIRHNERLKKDDSELEALLTENERLRAELSSYLSIKRSAKLLAGNIKRRIKYGKNR